MEKEIEVDNQWRMDIEGMIEGAEDEHTAFNPIFRIGGARGSYFWLLGGLAEKRGCSISSSWLSKWHNDEG